MVCLECIDLKVDPGTAVINVFDTAYKGIKPFGGIGRVLPHEVVNVVTVRNRSVYADTLFLSLERTVQHGKLGFPKKIVCLCFPGQKIDAIFIGGVQGDSFQEVDFGLFCHNSMTLTLKREAIVALSDLETETEYEPSLGSGIIIANAKSVPSVNLPPPKTFNEEP